VTCSKRVYYITFKIKCVGNKVEYITVMLDSVKHTKSGKYKAVYCYSLLLDDTLQWTTPFIDGQVNEPSDGHMLELLD